MQTWHVSDWPEGHESKITLVLTRVKEGTELTFTHSGVPDEFHDAIKQGWIDFHWTSMKAWIARHLHAA